MKNTIKRREDMSIDELIADAGWFDGGDREWRALPLAERDALAFKATGCAVAYATWPAPVDCVHTGCLILRGTLPSIALTNHILRSEAQSGYLRFIPQSTRDGRLRLARIYRAIRAQARATGVYDPWKMNGGWQVMVGAGIAG
jgi:hypothetical protein